MSSALRVIVLDFRGDFGFVGVTKLSAFCCMNFIIFGFPELICGEIAGVSSIEYPGGVKYLVSLIMPVLEEVFVNLSNIYCFYYRFWFFGTCFLVL